MSGSSLRLFEFLEAQPGLFFNKLYQQPSTALAIFRRMLPHMGWSDPFSRIRGAELTLRNSQNPGDVHAVPVPSTAGRGSGVLGPPRE
jgi:hypothetical protein